MVEHLQPTIEPEHAAPPHRDDEDWVRILAVDDHRAFREALGNLVSAAHGFVLIGQASSGEEAVRAVERLAPELVLMDVIMPGMGGIAAARTILSRHPDIVILLISVNDPAQHSGVEDLHGSVAYARKQDLCADQLREVWETHHT